MGIPEIEVLREGIKDGRFSIADVAVGVGVSWPAVQHWVQGKATPHRIFRRAIREWLRKIGAGDGLHETR